MVWHVSTPLPEQIVCPGAQTPVHAPATQAWLEHAVAFCQVPVALQFWGCWPLHCTWPGAHTPWHVPAEQVWFEHAEPLLCQAPPVLQVCGCCPLHCTAPGTQEPVHTPPTHD